jgi:hypothetical protein
MNVQLNYQDENLVIMRELACFGIEKRLIKQISNINPRIFEDYYNVFNAKPHREGMSWLSYCAEGYLADRVIRLYEKVICTPIDNPKSLTPKELLKLTKIYFSLYPNDDMSVNRIYYLIRSIKAGIVGVERECNGCGKVYHVHGEPGDNCGTCVALVKRKKQVNAAFASRKNRENKRRKIERELERELRRKESEQEALEKQEQIADEEKENNQKYEYELMIANSVNNENKSGNQSQEI